MPTGASAGRSMMPSCSSESSSSRSESSMPFEASPRIVPAFSSMPVPGMYVPGGANTPFMPVRAFGAPHTTCTGSPDRHRPCTRAAGRHSDAAAPPRPRAMTKGGSFSAGFVSDSSSSPSCVSASAIAAGGGVGVEIVLQPGIGEFHRSVVPCPAEALAGIAARGKPCGPAIRCAGFAEPRLRRRIAR